MQLTHVCFCTAPINLSRTPESRYLNYFVTFRKSHQRALESLQASLDVEVKGRTEASRVKKKMESDMNELEVQVDQLNKNNGELMKTVKKMQQQIKVDILPLILNVETIMHITIYLAQ